jgi:hypothetical protein
MWQESSHRNTIRWSGVRLHTIKGGAMEKFFILVDFASVLMIATPVFAADMAVLTYKAPPPVPYVPSQSCATTSKSRYIGTIR